MAQKVKGFCHVLNKKTERIFILKDSRESKEVVEVTYHEIFSLSAEDRQSDIWTLINRDQLYKIHYIRTMEFYAIITQKKQWGS